MAAHITTATETFVLMKTDNTLDILTKSMCDRRIVRDLVATSKSVAMLRKGFVHAAAKMVRTIVARAKETMGAALISLTSEEQALWISNYTSYVNSQISAALSKCFKLINEEHNSILNIVRLAA